MDYKTKYKYRVLNPTDFSGDANGDFGYELNGIKSTNSYVSRAGASNAMWRRIEKLEDNK